MVRNSTLIVTSELFGGSAFYVTQLASLLRSADVKVAVAFFANGWALESAIAHSDMNAIRLRSRFRTITGFINNMSQLRREINSTRPATIYTNTVFPLIAVALLRALGLLPKQLKIIHTLHSFFFDKCRGTVLRWLAASLERLVGFYVDRVIAPSQYMKSRGATIYGSEKILIIRNSLSEAREEALLHIRELRRNRVPHAPYKILFVGRADRQKGLDTLLEAFGSARTSRHMHLVLAGVKSSDLSGIIDPSHADNLNDVTPLGWLEDTAPLYLDADLFVMPSRWEAFGMSLLEAQLAGVPCIGTNVDAIPELITPTSGLIVEPGSPNTLTRAILEVVGRLNDFQVVPLEYLPLYARNKQQHLTLFREMTSDGDSAHRVQPTVAGR